MTKEEAIDYLQDARSALPYKFSEAIDMAIESLSVDTITDVIVAYDVEYLPDKDGIHQAKATITKVKAVQEK